MTYERVAPMIRELRLVKDKSYRRFPLGQEVARFLRALKAERKSEHTRRSYETVLRLFVLDHPDALDLASFCTPQGCDDLAAFLVDHWADAELTTMIQRHAVLDSCFEWARRTGRITWNPMEGLRRPRRPRVERYLPSQALIEKIISAQPWLRDQAGLLLMARLGFRREELREARISDFDLSRGLVFIRGKLDNDVYLPLEPYADVSDTLYLHITGEQRGGEEFLLYPKRTPLRQMSRAGVHNWFKRCLEAADAADFPMHSLRHAAIDEVRAASGNIKAAQQLARHADSRTTELYLHATRADLIAAMRMVEERRGGEEA